MQIREIRTEAWRTIAALLIFSGIGPALAASALIALDAALGGLLVPALLAAGLAAVARIAAAL